jgi:hypothetical protein
LSVRFGGGAPRAPCIVNVPLCILLPTVLRRFSHTNLLLCARSKGRFPCKFGSRKHRHEPLRRIQPNFFALRRACALLSSIAPTRSSSFRPKAHAVLWPHRTLSQNRIGAAKPSRSLRPFIHTVCQPSFVDSRSPCLSPGPLHANQSCRVLLGRAPSSVVWRPLRWAMQS